MRRRSFLSNVSGCVFVITVVATAAAYAQSTNSFYGALGTSLPPVAEQAALGALLFRDTSLSATGKMSCASCHDPAFAYGPNNTVSTKANGFRAVPSLRYLQNVPLFTEHFFEDEMGGADQGPTGGHTWDGRAQSIHDQARLPLLSPAEMGNRSPAEVVRRIRGAAYAKRFHDAFGERIWRDDALLFKAAMLALEVFQQTPEEFYPYTSKYDAVLRGKARLTTSEANGLRLFVDPAKGNCAVCHPATVKAGALPAFTDWGFVALGVPRNRALPANARKDFHDLGLCGPARTDFSARAEYCGLFRTPSLRNVALRKSFFHNGRFTQLQQVLEFYVQRDLQPQKFYSIASNGKAVLFDDLPAAYHVNINREAPFDRTRGQAPALSREEIRDVIAFLGTLTDGYRLEQLTARRP